MTVLDLVPQQHSARIVFVSVTLSVKNRGLLKSPVSGSNPGTGLLEM